MKKVELTHAEVTALYGTKDVIKEVNVEGKGTIINFSVKTRINDRVANSPLIFEKCTFFATSAEQTESIKEMIKLGNILDIKGAQDRSSYTDKSTGTKKYSDSVKVREITPVQVSTQSVGQNSSVEDDLPF
jgi:hypothetical protein